MYNKVSKMPYKHLRHWAATPFILGMAAPIAILDVSLEIYHRVAFPLYGIPVNKRSDYIKLDRQKLAYLSLIDKCWCTYCGYANGLMPYAAKIAADTEKYWCAVKHKEDTTDFQPHHKDFLDFGDEEAYREFIAKGKGKN